MALRLCQRYADPRMARPAWRHSHAIVINDLHSSRLVPRWFRTSAVRRVATMVSPQTVNQPVELAPNQIHLKTLEREPADQHAGRG